MNRARTAVVEAGIRVAEISQYLGKLPLISRLYRDIRDASTGSTSDAYGKAWWRTAKHTEGGDLVEIEADPHARGSKRFHQNAVVVGVAQTALAELLETIDPDLGPVPAMAYRIPGGRYHVGLLPKPFGQVGTGETEQTLYDAGALRHGPELFYGGLGWFTKPDRTLHIPQGLVVIEAFVEANTLLPAQYRGVPLA